jgi:ketosteroid isomerase-like protein
MAEENVESLRHVYAKWERADFTPRFELYAPDWEWGWSDEFPGLGGVKRDPSNERLREWLSPWEQWRVEAEEYIPAGEHVVVLCRYTGRGKGSGVDVNSEGAHLWTFRDGRAVRLEIFSSRDRALAAAGA